MKPKIIIAALLALFATLGPAHAEKLTDAYKRYAYVKYCNEIRQGYAVVFINEIELERARAQIKAIEEKALKDYAGPVDTGSLFRKSAGSLNGLPVSAQLCHRAYYELFEYQTDGPSALSIQKDF